jgi:hypothetical protein
MAYEFSRENSKTFPKIRGTALVTLNKVEGNPVSYECPHFSFFSVLDKSVKDKYPTMHCSFSLASGTICNQCKNPVLLLTKLSNSVVHSTCNSVRTK